MSLLESIPELPGSGDHTVFAPGQFRSLLEHEVLPRYIAGARWFGGKARVPRTFVISNVVSISPEPKAARLVFVEITYAEGPPDTYLLPLQIAAGEFAEFIFRTTPNAALGRFQDGAVLFDALHDEAFRTALFDLIIRGGILDGAHGKIAATPGPILRDHTSAPPSHALGVEQSNSSIIYGDQIFLKLYRRLEEGVNPDAEILQFLGARSFPHVPPFCGAIEYRSASGVAQTLALATGLVPNDGDAWAFTLRHLTEFFGRLRDGDTAGAEKFAATYYSDAAQLGQRTGELHLALASDTWEADFAPEPLASGDFSTLASAIRISIQRVRTLLVERLGVLDSATRSLAEELLAKLPALLARVDALPALTTRAAKTRTHGDYHLGQVLHGPGGFVIIDFEGEPLRSLAERRRKMSPFRDVAGMLRSFHYAAHAALEPLADSRAQLAEAAERWHQRAATTFLESWFSITRDAVFRDPDAVCERALLDAYLLEKALYEVCYEVNNRPTWLALPLRGVLALLDHE